MTAEQAQTHGLVTRLAGRGAPALDPGVELAERTAKHAPLSLAITKQVRRQTQGRTEEFWAFRRR